MSQKIKSITTRVTYEITDDMRKEIPDGIFDTVTTTRYYDKEQHLIRKVENAENFKEGLYEDAITYYTYDSEGRLIEESDTLEWTKYNYLKDEDGNDVVEKIHEDEIEGDHQYCKTYVYDTKGNLIRLTYDDQNINREHLFEYLDDEKVRVKTETLHYSEDPYEEDQIERDEEIITRLEASLFSQIYEHDSYNEEDVLPEKTEYWDED